jgi:hypothetical protein
MAISWWKRWENDAKTAKKPCFRAIFMTITWFSIEKIDAKTVFYLGEGWGEEEILRHGHSQKTNQPWNDLSFDGLRKGKAGRTRFWFVPVFEKSPYVYLYNLYLISHI